MPTDADRVWNRACLGEMDGSTLRGDRALSALLVFHGFAMNGGILHPFGCMQPRQLAVAKSGYRFFGLHDVAELISDIGSVLSLSKLSDAQEVSFSLRYSKSVPDDSALYDRFEKYYDTHKSDFAPPADADGPGQLRP